MLGDERVPVLGAVENMVAAACPHCGGKVAIFPAVRHERSIWALGVDRLGSIPLDPALADAGDNGVPRLAREPQGPHAAAFRSIADAIVARLAESERRAVG